jgi:hypothetical protein
LPELFYCNSGASEKELQVLTTPQGLVALRRLRQELQEDAGCQFPQAVLREMLILYDVCKSLDLNIFQCREVLGELGWQYLHEYINKPLELRLTA